jgi:AraC family transcriptional regulator
MESQASNTAIRTFLRGGSVMKLTSHEFGWTNLVLEEHEASPREIPEVSIDSILLMQWRGNRNARGEHASSGNAFVSYKKRPGMMTLYPPGFVPAARTATPSELLFCALDKRFFSTVLEQHREDGSRREGIGRRGIASDEPMFFDPHLSQLVLLLRDETRSGGESGPLYAEYLTHALAARLVAIIVKNGASGSRPSEALSAKALHLIIDRMEADPFSSFRIEGLAAEAGYSYNRFLQAFRSSTGYTPHQYLLHLRLTRAKDLMGKRDRPLLDIALECGFASHAHFTRAFRKRYGISPSEFRGNR